MLNNTGDEKLKPKINRVRQTDRQTQRRERAIRILANSKDCELKMLLIVFFILSAVKAGSQFKNSLSANRLETRKIQNGRQIRFILKIVDIFVDIFHSL